MKLKIEQIQVVSNPRKDFGKIEELTASVKDKGVLEPLIVKQNGEGRYELVAGERRFRAATHAGLKEVPVHVLEGDDSFIDEVKLIENIQRKNFNIIEEAEGFNAYLDRHKSSPETLAKMLGKPTLYVERRLELLKLPENIRTALQNGEILLGHGLALARVKETDDQNELFEDIQEEGLNVEQTLEHISYRDLSLNLDKARFDLAECKGCKHNGGEQTLLFGDSAGLKGECMHKKCFMDKSMAWMKEETKKLQEKGITVLSTEELSKIKKRESVSEYNQDYDEIKAKLSEEPENYCIEFSEDCCGILSDRIWCINPAARHRHLNQSSTSGVTSSQVSASQPEDNLARKVSDFKHAFLVQKVRSLVTDSQDVKSGKALALYALLKEGTENFNNDDLRHNVQDYAKKFRLNDEDPNEEWFGNISFKQINELSEEQIDEHMRRVPAFWSNAIFDELPHVGKTFGLDLETHFIITEDYLKMHTKDQLISLAKEIGLDAHLEEQGIGSWNKMKKTEMMDFFLNSGFDLTGKVPRLMQ